MKFIVYLSGLLLIFLLPRWIESSKESVDLHTLARIINFFEQNYKRVDCDETARQYATAINVPKYQCKLGFTPLQDNFLTQEDGNKVKNSIGDDTTSLYKGQQLIAAGTKLWKKRKYTHSECLLLNPANDSPMKELLDTNNQDCSIFYTFNSPCFTSCLKETGKYNILEALDNWSKHGGIKAFVFRQFWKYCQRIDLQSKLKLIASRVPLYRCLREECYACNGGGNSTIDENCLPAKTDPSKTTMRNEI